MSTVRKNKPKNVLISYLNVNSIKHKIDEIKTTLSNFIDVLILAETKLDKSHPTSEFSMNGFRTPFRRDRNRFGAGLLFYVNERIPCKRLNQNLSPDCEIVVVELNLRKHKWQVIGLYRPPNQNSKYFLSSLSNIIDQYNSIYDKIICLGDFNLDPKQSDMNDFMLEHNMFNLIREPTCFKSVSNPSCGYHPRLT